MHRSRITAYLQKTRKSSLAALPDAQPLSDGILAAKTVFCIPTPPRHCIWWSSSKYDTIYAAQEQDACVLLITGKHVG